MKKVQQTDSSADRSATESFMYSEKDFVILCPSAADSLLVQAALYFLPKNYKLRVLTETFQDIKPFSEDQSIMQRISFGSRSELDQSSADRGVNAVIYSEPTAISESSAPRVVITKETTAAANQHPHDQWTVPSDSPEAVASAMLRIARMSFA